MSNMYTVTTFLLASLAVSGCFDGNIKDRPCQSDEICQLGNEDLLCLGGYPNGKCSVPVADDLPVSIGLGMHHSCAVMGSGSVRCWGSNQKKQLGYPMFAEKYPELLGCGAPQELGDVKFESSSHRVIQVVGGGADEAGSEQHTCVLRSDGSVKCWGIGKDGESEGWLGQVLDDTVWADPAAVPPLDLGEVKKIAAGYLGACALLGGKDDGELVCWGSGAAEFLGGPGPLQNAQNRLNFNGGRVQDISLGFAHMCAVMTDGSLYCWGQNQFGQVGTEPFDCEKVDTPKRVKIDGAVTMVGAGRYHTCALVGTREIWCWGSPDNAALGTEAPPTDCLEGGTLTARKPTLAPGLDIGVDVKKIVAADHFGCLLTVAGEVHCWGKSEDGRLGSSTIPDSFEPVLVPIDGAVAQVEARGHHACAVTDDGEVWCWGSNQSGQSGYRACTTPTQGTASPSPVGF